MSIVKGLFGVIESGFDITQWFSEKARADAAQREDRTLVWSGENHAGRSEIWEEKDGVRKHYREGALEAIEYRHRMYDPGSAVAKAWFADGVTESDRKPVFLERLVSPLGPDPDTGVTIEMEIWEDPVAGRFTRHVEDGVDAGQIKVGAPDLEKLRDKVRRGEAGGARAISAGPDSAAAVAEPDLNKLRDSVRREAAASGPEPEI